MTVKITEAPLDALYRDVTTNETVKLLGLKRRTVVLQKQMDSTIFEVTTSDFEANYEDTGVHDHENSCCSLHGTHSTPHSGCILR